MLASSAPARKKSSNFFGRGRARKMITTASSAG